MSKQKKNHSRGENVLDMQTNTQWPRSKLMSHVRVTMVVKIVAIRNVKNEAKKFKGNADTQKLTSR